MRWLLTLSLMLAFACERACGQAVAPLLSQSAFIDAQGVLGMRSGAAPRFPSGNNSTRLTAGLGSNKLRASVFIPGGDWELPETVNFPNTWGPSLYGPGGLTGPLGEAHYKFGLYSHASSQVTRLIWTGPNNGTMFAIYGAGYTISGLNFQGCRVSGAGPEPIKDIYPNQAAIGLHILPSTTTGARTTAKCNLSHLGFWQIDTGILIGRDLNGVGEERFPGDTDSHADSVYAEDLHFGHPWAGSKAGIGSCVHIRNQQSMDNYFNAIYSGGSPAQVFYLERGGKTHVGMISTSGTTIAVRVGIIGANEGGLTVGHIALDGGTKAKLLKGDVHNSPIATPYCEIQSASVPESCTAIPQVDVGPGTWVIRNCNYLRAGSIKMTGVKVPAGSGQSKRVCHVMLDNVTTYACNIDELVDPSSSGPYMLTWRNCHRMASGTQPIVDWGMPFEDSRSDTEIKNEVTRLAPVTP
jgi:hypothetical protein